MSCSERLLGYYPFGPEIVGKIDEIAQRHQSSSGWDEYRRVQSYPEVERFRPAHGNPVEVWDRIPKDYEDILVFHSTSGNPLNPNILGRVSVLADALPHTRVVAFGSHGGIGKRTGSVALRDLGKVWAGDYRPGIEPNLAYLQHHHMEESKQQGYSLGAEKPPVLAVNAERFDHKVTHMILLDPATVVTRRHRELLHALSAAEKRLPEYQAAADSPFYRDAILLSHSRIRSGLRLASPTNLAYWGGQTKADDKVGFEARMDVALRNDPNLLAVVSWGTESELAIHALMTGIITRLRRQYPWQLGTLQLAGHGHAYGNDLYLHAAATLQGLAVISSSKTS